MRRLFWLMAGVGGVVVAGCGGRSRLPLPAPPAVLVATPDEAFLAPPEAASSTDALALPIVEETTLANGMRLFVVSADDLPLVSVVLVSRAGTSDDRGVAPGLDELLENVLERRARERLPGLVRPDVGVYSTGAWVWTEGAATRLGPMLDSVADIARTPNMPATLVREERSVLVDQIVDASRSYSVRVRNRHERMLIYGASDPRARHWYGDLDSFRTLSAEQLVARHGTLFAPAASALVVVGDVDASEIAARFDATFGTWSTPLVPVETLPVAAFPTPPARLHAFPVSGPATIALRERAPPREHGDRPAFEVATAILGGMFGARINRVLREERGHTYGVHANLNDYRGYAILEVELAVPSAHVRQTVYDLIAELRRVQDADQIEEAELVAARATAIAGYRRQLSTRSGTAFMLASLFLRNETLQVWRERAAAIGRVSAEDVARVSTHWLRPDAAPLLVSGEYLRMMELTTFMPGGADLVLEY